MYVNKLRIHCNESQTILEKNVGSVQEFCPSISAREKASSLPPHSDALESAAKEIYQKDI